MIKRLKIKFIILSMTSLFALLALVVIGMNIINYSSVCREADDVLSVISQGRGTFPDFEEGRRDRLPPGMSPELPYESRYFSVSFDKAGNVIRMDLSRIITVDKLAAQEYAAAVLTEESQSGFIGDFRFAKNIEEDGIRITFLDCGRKLTAFHTFMLVSISMASLGFVIVFFIIAFCAGRIIKPIAESYEKQKRFITDAGHEIKTPLTIIGANVDILEMDVGQSECLDDIKQQVKRLTTLTNELVYLTRMEEADNALPMVDFPVSEVVLETAMPFKALAQAEEKELGIHVEPLLSMRGNNKAIQQLVSVLMDNAVKYSPRGGKIKLTFVKQARSVVLTVYNRTASAMNPADLAHVFDRFYRTDPSRNSEIGGYGIGLSVAKAIVTAHGGKIQAGTDDERSFCITVTFPI